MNERSLVVGAAIAASLAAGLTRSILAATPAPDPSQDGPNLIRHEVLAASLASGEILPFTVAMPAGATRPLPVALVVHGYATVGQDYSWIADHLATRGFVTALVEVRDPYDPDLEEWATETLATLDALERANANPWSGLFQTIDASRVSAIGHSYGGATSIVAAARDARIKAVAALEPGADDPWHAVLLSRASAVRVPLLVVGGQLDPICPPATQGIPAFQAASSATSHLYVEIAGADHLGFVDFFWAGPFAPYIPFWQEHTIASRYFTAWLERFGAGSPDPGGYTDGTAAAHDLTAGTLSQWMR